MRERCYVLLKKDDLADRYVGLVEHSFSMGFSEQYIRVWRVNEYTSRAKMVDHLQKIANKDNLVVYRVGSKNCPIKIDWKSFHSTPIDKLSKFNYRNLKFSLRS